MSGLLTAIMSIGSRVRLDPDAIFSGPILARSPNPKKVQRSATRLKLASGKFRGGLPYGRP